VRIDRTYDQLAGSVSQIHLLHPVIPRLPIAQPLL